VEDEVVRSQNELAKCLPRGPEENYENLRIARGTEENHRIKLDPPEYKALHCNILLLCDGGCRNYLTSSQLSIE
jgi:hypothetical protein